MLEEEDPGGIGGGQEEQVEWVDLGPLGDLEAVGVPYV